MSSLLAAAWLVAATAGSADTDCLGCHGDKNLKSDRGRSLYVDKARHGQSVHGGLACTDCHAGLAEYPHPTPVPRADCVSCHGDEAKEIAGGVHASLEAEACSGCHGPPHDVRPTGKAVGAECVGCHADEVSGYLSSVHGKADVLAGAGAAGCHSCHEPAHRMRSSADAASTIAKKNLADTCGACHANPDFLARYKIAVARPVEAYRLSVHGLAVAQGNDRAPSCSDCHGTHEIAPATEARSPIHHRNVPGTCGTCHREIAATFATSVHGQAVEQGVADAPVCTDCHGEHRILAPSEPQSLVNPARVSTVTCGRCHGDERLAEKYNLPVDRVPAFQDSYHGLALRAGSQTVANCASCHGVHNILPASDPRSTVHPGNLARTCGSCHPGAGQRFAIGSVHWRPASASEHPVVRWIRVIYLWLIPLTLGFMALHNGADFIVKLVRGVRRGHSGDQIPRMGLHFRIAHGLTVLSFPVLVVTGFALKFPESWWAEPLLRWEGHMAFRGLVHRVAGVVLILSLLYHGIHLVLARRARAIIAHLWPRRRDARDLWEMLRYNHGLAPRRPAFRVFSYAEKLEYLAFVWGSVVMAVTGLLLWFNTFTLTNFPSWVLDAATVAHYYEAILATLAIVVWHFYMVIFDPEVYPMDRAWITGKTSADHVRATRPAYYRRLMQKQRRRTEDVSPDTPPSPGRPPVKSEPKA